MRCTIVFWPYPPPPPQFSEEPILDFGVSSRPPKYVQFSCVSACSLSHRGRYAGLSIYEALLSVEGRAAGQKSKGRKAKVRATAEQSAMLFTHRGENPTLKSVID